ncbi:hypothetical protein DHEL01_v209473 [Diaporthe helianthi]|uniref:Uncharacterized protein n=1 Tax=Diaporthe helianthi TaxID=158607 RepID=A0A2P5HPF8_DIAHE|nr:hypothetical protein DHEL01_v209473 [Diaporthe helianthi]
MDAVHHAGSPAWYGVQPQASLHRTGPLCSTQSPFKVSAWRSARVAFRSSALTPKVAKFHFQHPQLAVRQFIRADGQLMGQLGAAFKQREQKWHRHIRPQKRSPTLHTRPLLTKRPGLADLDWTSSQSHATAPTRPAATLLGPLFLLGQLRQSHPIAAISGSGSHSQLQVRRSPRRHWLADWVGEKTSASVMACRSIASRKG